MLIVKNVNKDETAIQAYNIEVKETFGTLSTLNFAFVENDKNKVGADMMIPRTIITEPVTQQQYRIITNNPVPGNKKRIYTISANHVGGDLHDNYIEPKLIATQSLKNCMDHITKGTKFNYKINGTFSNYSFSEGFGGDYADSLLNNLASDFGFEFYFDNYMIHIAKSIGKTDAFLFIDGSNISKISVLEDYSVINTYMKGYSGTPDETTGIYPISAEYYSPLADSKQWGKIDGGIYTNENMQKPALEAELKSQVHDYPNVQYSVSYVDFKKNMQGFSNDCSIGNYGWLRDRFGIDTKVRVQERTFYPQDSKNNGSITFGNIMIDPIRLQLQMKKGYEDNVKLGKSLETSISGIKKSSDKIGESVNKIKKDTDASYPWKSKSVTVLGDSITYGQINGSSNHADPQWTEYLATIAKFKNVANKGIAGAKIAVTAAAERIEPISITAESVSGQDMVIVFGGINDFIGVGKGLGDMSSTDVSTFYGALKHIVSTLKANNPTAKLVFITPMKQSSNLIATYDSNGNLQKNSDGYTQLDFVSAIQNVCGYYSISVIDMYGNSDINPYLDSSSFQDGLHPTQTGYEILGRQIARIINTL